MTAKEIEDRTLLRFALIVAARRSKMTWAEAGRCGGLNGVDDQAVAMHAMKFCRRQARKRLMDISDLYGFKAKRGIPNQIRRKAA